MRQTRIIPQILIHNNGVYKTVRFSKPRYIGDPINTIKLFNELEVDELFVVDIDCSKNNNKINYNFIEDIVGEARMPVTYGGGITCAQSAISVLQSGIEKILINKSFIKDDSIISKIQAKVGSQSVVVSLNVKKDSAGKFFLYDYISKKNIKISLIDAAILAEKLGAGELIVTSVEKDGMLNGLDLGILEDLNEVINIPIIICGGAKSYQDFIEAQKLGASGVAAGSLFVYHGKINGILINYPSQSKLNSILQ